MALLFVVRKKRKEKRLKRLRGECLVLGNPFSTARRETPGPDEPEQVSIWLSPLEDSIPAAAYVGGAGGRKVGAAG